MRLINADDVIRLARKDKEFIECMAGIIDIEYIVAITPTVVRVPDYSKLGECGQALDRGEQDTAETKEEMPANIQLRL